MTNYFAIISIIVTPPLFLIISIIAPFLAIYSNINENIALISAIFNTISISLIFLIIFSAGVTLQVNSTTMILIYYLIISGLVISIPIGSLVTAWMYYLIGDNQTRIINIVLTFVTICVNITGIISICAWCLCTCFDNDDSLEQNKLVA